MWADLELVGRRTTRGRLGRCNPCATLLLDRNRLDSINGKNGNGWGSLACTLSGDNGMSYGFMVEGESLAPAPPRGGGSTGAAVEPGVRIIGDTGEDDSAIGAGWISSFSNKKGVFRWNEDGTKMVYTPATSGRGNQQAQAERFQERRSG